MSPLHRFYEFVNRHAIAATIAVIATALVLGFVGPQVANTDDPNFDPTTKVFQLADTAAERLDGSSTVESAFFIVESEDGIDVLTADALREWQAAVQRVVAEPANQAHLIAGYDDDLAAALPGIFSIADIVEGRLEGGLVQADDAAIKAVVGELIAQNPATRQQLSEHAAEGPDGWTSPAFAASVVYDEATFPTYADSELWLREVQDQLGDGAVHIAPVGVAIDFDTSFDEAINASAPFIFLAVALIVLLVAIVHRSYWSAMLVGAGLGLTVLVYGGIASLIGLKMGSLMLVFIVPIATISFGVDFYIHGVGRVREVQVDGVPSGRAYPAGMTAVFTAMLLAVLSSMAAFLANASSGTEAIVEFGVGAAIALAAAYLILGQLAPRVLLGIEGWIGESPAPGRWRYLYRAAIVPAVVVAGLAVTLAAVMPEVGVVAVAASVILLLVVPVLLTRRRNRKAVAAGRPTTTGIAGAAHGLAAAGSLVATLARRRAVTLPGVVLIGIGSLVLALRAESGFELVDFLPADSNPVESIAVADEHFGGNGQGGSLIYIEGDLSEPDTLAALDAAVASLRETDAEVGRTATGELITDPHAGDLVRAAAASPDVVARLAAAGTPLTDSDGDGLPDTAAQVQAVFDDLTVHGLSTPDGEQIYSAADIPELLANDGPGVHATAITVRVGSFTDGDVIGQVRAALESTADELTDAAPALTTVGVTGEVITQFESLEAFRDSMLLSLPIAVLLTLLLAAAVLRSFRYAVASVVPVGFVVAGVYAFMTIADYRINVVTATIAAIAVGVGIDFSTHFTVRFREELGRNGRRIEALRQAGAGTGGALVLSALSSVLGFLVMALAPTPIFATFGMLTAVMIALALAAALVVLPSVLLLVAPSQPTSPLLHSEKQETPELVLAGF